MNQQVAIAEQPQRRSVTVDMANRYGMDAAPFESVLRATVVPKECSKEQFAAFLLVAREHNLNPITREIFAFPKQGGGIQPIVSVDGWANLVNSHPQCDGFEFADEMNDKGELVAITCRIFRKDRKHPSSATEYMSECKRDTATWKQWPRRMLRHKALIQAARYTFGFAGIVDPDEAERAEAGHYDKTPGPRLVPPPAPSSASAQTALTINNEWQQYLERQLEELGASIEPHQQAAVRDATTDFIQAARERGDLSQAEADAITDRWEEMSAE